MAEGLDFDSWISERLEALNTDETVFAPYVKSIVEGDDSIEEKMEALCEILAELADGTLDVQEFVTEILMKWENQKKNPSKNSSADAEREIANADLQSKFENILKLSEKASESNNDIDGKCSKSLSQSPDKALRAAILNKYRDDDSEDEPGESKSKNVPTVQRGAEGLERNTNAERVLNELKDKREKEKADAAKKRERDKEDRAKQKQQMQERKDKAKKKAAKVERKR